ncbi:MAG: hypothetical protein V1792_06385 [Pseudomonadota bacterium]
MPGEEIARHGVSVLVWCLMTNHVHFVVVPHREESPALVEDWERLLLSSGDGRLSTLRKRTRTGRPAGDAVFLARVEKITGRDLRKGKPGRPRKPPS